VNTGLRTYLGKYRDLLFYRVLLESKTDTRQFYFGLSWWVIEPLVNLAMMYLVFGVIMQRGGPGFVGFLLVGFVIFRWIDGSVKKALQSFNAARSIITQIRLANWLFPVADMLASSLRFLVILLLLIVFCVWYSGQFGSAYLALPLILGLNMAFIIGLGLTLALIPPFIPDSRKIIDNVFTLLFFASGIFYDISKLSPEIAGYLYLNPIASFITSYRLIMLENQLPTWDLLRWPSLCTVLLLVSSALAYRRFSPHLARALLR